MPLGCTARVCKPFACRHLICFPKTRKLTAKALLAEFEMQACSSASLEYAEWRRV